MGKSKTLVCDGFKFDSFLGASFKEFVTKSMFFVVTSFWCYIASVLGFFFGKFLSSSGQISGEFAPVSSDHCDVSEEFNSGEKNSPAEMSFSTENSELNSGENAVEEEMSCGEISGEIAPFSRENSEELNSGENAVEEGISYGEISGEIAPFSSEKSQELNSGENCHEEEMNYGEISGEIAPFSSENSAELNSGENCHEEEMNYGEISGEIAPVSSKYEFCSGNTVCSFIEEPQTMNFTVQEMFVIHHDSTDDASSPTDHDLVVIDPSSSEHFYCPELNPEESCDVNLEDKYLSEHELSDEVQSSRNSSDDFWASIHKYDEFDSDEDDIPFVDQTSSFPGHLETRKEPEFDPEPRHNSPDLDDEFDQKSSTKSGEDQTEEDVLVEQKELIRQMKREMRHLKVSGLPTILEESESPRVEDDLRPLKIEERVLGHKDRMDEIQSLYRMYLDKMRKLDILCQQTMYAIGLLQLKNQDDLSSNKKSSSSVPVLKSLLAQNFWSNKLRKHEADPVQRLIRDFQRDLELVYVGQLCLSWETLKWQHQKAQQLHCHDPDGFRQHNQVAGEFQKFQVVLQRFTEDEPFHHGPRVQHYVKTRCALPNLLQVPLIKDDPRAEWRGKGEGGISIGMLKEVIGASMRTFWEFLRADKDHEFHTMSLMGIHGHPVDLQDPLDAELLVEVRSNLQKKEKRLKDLVKSGNCIVKKLQKHRDHQLSHEMFLAQVELRLVSRVLNMSRLTTDQLLWCHKKISKINIVGRKIYLESSVLLFPC